MRPSSADFLARFLGDLQRTFGAEILEARDDMDGALWVDVRMDAGRAMRTRRVLIRKKASEMCMRSREILDLNGELQHHTAELVAAVRPQRRSSQARLEDCRSRMTEIRRKRAETAHSSTKPTD